MSSDNQSLGTQEVKLNPVIEEMPLEQNESSNFDKDSIKALPSVQQDSHNFMELNQLPPKENLVEVEHHSTYSLDQQGDDTTEHHGRKHKNPTDDEVESLNESGKQPQTFKKIKPSQHKTRSEAPRMQLSSQDQLKQDTHGYDSIEQHHSKLKPKVSFIEEEAFDQAKYREEGLKLRNNQEMEDVNKLRREFQSERPFSTKLLISAVSSALVTGAVYAAKKDRKVSAIAGVATMALSFLMQK